MIANTFMLFEHLLTKHYFQLAYKVTVRKTQDGNPLAIVGLGVMVAG
jgi:hypothetical protein